MFNIYFRDEHLNYYRPIHVEDIEETLKIVALYRYIVPNILVTDSDDYALLELKRGVSYFGESPKQEDVDMLNTALSMSVTSIANTFDFDTLIKSYQSKVQELQTNNNSKLKEEIRSLDMKILAVAANNNINLSEYTYRSSELYIDMVEDAEILNKNDISKLLENFLEELDNGKTLIIMPLDRIIFDDIIKLKNFVFLTPNSIDFNQSWNITHNLFDNGLRSAASTFTQFNINILYQSHCVAFCYDLDWGEFQSFQHSNDDITLLKILSSYANEIFNLIRFDFCDFYLPDTLPGEVGSWSQSSDYLGALLYNKNKDHQTAYLVAGSAIEATKIVKGIGLDFNGGENIPWSYEHAHSEIQQVIKNSLSLYSDAMQSHSSTTKFIRIMTLFEYMAYPNEYKNFQTVKKYIICHCVTSKKEYHELGDRFKTLSQDYRTSIIHNGLTLENLVPKYEDRVILFKELQKYCKKTIAAMFLNQEKPWDDFIAYRNNLINSF